MLLVLTVRGCPDVAFGDHMMNATKSSSVSELLLVSALALISKLHIIKGECIMDSSDNKLKIIKAILYASDGISTEDKLNAVRYLVYGWDNESDVGNKSYQPSWLNDLSVETRDVVDGLSND